MADRKNNSPSITCEEIESLMTAFGQSNNCVISIEMRVGVLAGKKSLEMVAWAWNNREERPEPPLLASASVRCSALHTANLEGAIIRLLYVLDFQLASEEYARTFVKAE